MDKAYEIKINPTDTLDQRLLDKRLSDGMKDTWEYRVEDMNKWDYSAHNLLTVSFISFYKDLHNENKEILKSFLTGKEIVDIGCGHNNHEYKKIFLDFGAKNYTGIDLWNSRNNNTENNEVLGFLSSQSDSSLDIITSNGFMCSEMVADGQYSQRVLHHIYRTLKPDGIFMATHFDLNDLAVNSGFQLETSINKRNETLSGILIYKKIPNQSQR